jgi:hypothetical protein
MRISELTHSFDELRASKRQHGTDVPGLRVGVPPPPAVCFLPLSFILRKFVYLSW